MLFITDLIDKQVSMAVLKNVLYSITWIHQICVYDHYKASTVRINEEAERILSKLVIKKEPFTPHMLQKLYKCLVKMIQILLI